MSGQKGERVRGVEEEDSVCFWPSRDVTSLEEF